MKLDSSKKYIYLTSLLAVIIILIIILREWGNLRPVFSMLNLEKFLTSIKQYRFLDIFLFLLLLACFSIVPGLPVSVIGILSGIIFGKIIGSFINVTGMVAGNLIAQRIFINFNEHIDKRKKKTKFGQKIRSMNHPSMGIVIGYAIPFIPTSIISLTSVSTNLSRKKVITATIIGSLPMAIIYALGGNAIIQSHFKELVVLSVIILLLVLLIFLIDKDRKKTSI
ncbi:TVP38/TMEM64 family protein [Lactobacillus terrae]|uniref:TVP38/TMEM64 family protein n=1 Tax=Lactobacillus terrae TaxID=2269374 RepID=UPI000C1B710E|nr:VTT domain-containing protein [Lactobacillus terrae]